MKDLKINEIKPMFTTVITTLDVYEEDLVENGLVKAPKGTLKMYQRVLATGSSVRDINVGDLVLINFGNYAHTKYRKDNSFKENVQEMEDEVVFDIPRMLLGGKIVGKFQDRDIDGVITNYEEYETEQAKPALR